MCSETAYINTMIESWNTESITKTNTTSYEINNNLSIYLLLAIYYEAEHLYNNVDNDLVGSHVLLLLLLHSHSVLLKTTTIFIMKGI